MLRLTGQTGLDPAWRAGQDAAIGELPRLPFMESIGMNTSRDRVGMLAVAVACGTFVVGWMLVGGRGDRVLASAGDRNGASIVQTGMITEVRDRQGKTLATQDGLYILNYSNGLLLAAVPSYQQISGSIRILSDFAERDLIRDFGLPAGSSPKFMMTTIQMGIVGQDWAPLVVLELESGQVATYRLLPQVTVGSTRPNFQLLERRTDARLAKTLAAAAVNTGAARED